MHHQVINMQHERPSTIPPSLTRACGVQVNCTQASGCVGVDRGQLLQYAINASRITVRPTA
jgi:hypothetical protein